MLGEVSAAITGFPGIDVATCYGVKVPGYPGRAGMVALQMQHGAALDTRAFHAWVNQRLPSFAAPLFVRVMAVLEVTATLKLRKADLVDQAYSQQRIGDPLFVRDDAAGDFVPLTPQSLARLGLPEAD